MEPEHLLITAIEKQVRVMATYNKGRVILAPHALYKRHDELYVDAVTIERDGIAPREQKLGTFKVGGLNEPCLDNFQFKSFSGFRSTDPKYAGGIVVSVDALRRPSAGRAAIAMAAK